MLVTALGLLLGGRADTGAVRTGARAARVEGVVARRRGRSPRSPTSTAARSRPASCCSAGRSPPRVARAPSWAAPRCRPPRWPRVGDALVAVHGQSDQHRLLKPEAQRDALDAFAGARARRGAGALPRRVHAGCARSRPSCARCSARRASAPARPTCSGSGSRRSRRSTRSRGEDESLADRGVPARVRRHAAHRGRDRPRGAVVRPGRARRARRGGRRPPGAGERARARPRGRPAWPTGSPR